MSSNYIFKCIKARRLINCIYFRPKDKSIAISVYMQNTFMQLKKIVNHPYLIQMPLIPGENKLLVNEDIVKVSGKIQLLDAMLSKLKMLGHKVLYTLKGYLIMSNVLLIVNNRYLMFIYTIWMAHQ